MIPSKDDKNSSVRFGKAMAFIAAALILGLLTLFFNDWLEKQHNPNQQVQTGLTADGVIEVQLIRNKSGHYIATGTINHQAVVFLIDTGASHIAIPTHLAQKLNLAPGQPIIYQTANGSVQGYTTQVDQVTLGDITLNNVSAGINPGMQGLDILLGMSFLKQLEFTQRGNTLTLRQYPR